MDCSLQPDLRRSPTARQDFLAPDIVRVVPALEKQNHGSKRTSDQTAFLPNYNFLVEARMQPTTLNSSSIPLTRGMLQTHLAFTLRLASSRSITSPTTSSICMVWPALLLKQSPLQQIEGASSATVHANLAGPRVAFWETAVRNCGGPFPPFQFTCRPKR